MTAFQSRRTGPETSRRWLAMGAVVLAVMAIGLDVTVLNLALPTLSASLGASEAQLQWFVSAYTLALAASMLPSGLVGDRFGRKRVMLAALVVFGAASVGCAISPSPEAFIAARTVLGMAGAALVVMSLSLVTVLFEESERPRAMGLWAAANFLSLPLGPIVGGYILAHFWWGWVFLMNVPVILVGLIAVAWVLPESRGERRSGIDLAGVALSSAGLALVMYGLTQAGDKGWGDGAAIGASAAGVTALALFVGWEAILTRRPGGEPLIDLALFRSRSFRSGLVLAAVGIFGLMGVLFALPQYLQAVVGLDAQGTGLRFLPAIAGMAAGAIGADRLAARFGPAVTVSLGFAIGVVGLWMGSGTSATSGDGFLAAWTALVGFGSGVGLATAASAAIIELTAERSGVGSGLVQAVIKLGPAFGATILGSVLNSTYQGSVSVSGLPSDVAATVKDSVFGGLAVAAQVGSQALLESVRTAFVAGIDDALRAAAMFLAVAAVAALVIMPRRRRATAGAGGTAAGEIHGAPAPVGGGSPAAD